MKMVFIKSHDINSIWTSLLSGLKIFCKFILFIPALGVTGCIHWEPATISLEEKVAKTWSDYSAQSNAKVTKTGLTSMAWCLCIWPILHVKTKCRGRVVNTPASYSGCPGFKSQPRRPATLIEGFVVLFSPSTQMPRYYLKITPQLLPTKSFPNHHHLLITLSSTLYSLISTEKATQIN
jgi:hypothetical protein